MRKPNANEPIPEMTAVAVMISRLMPVAMSNRISVLEGTYQSSKRCMQHQSRKLGRPYQCRRRYRHSESRLKPEQSTRRLQDEEAGTNINCYNVCHCKKRCKSSPNFSEELGTFPLLGL